MTESAVFWTAYFRERPAYSRILQELRQKYRMPIPPVFLPDLAGAAAEIPEVWASGGDGPPGGCQ